MTMSKLIRAATLSLLMVSFGAQADLIIQNAQYKAEKQVLFVKGKLKNNSASLVYVVNADTNRLLATLSTKGDQFRADLAFAENQIPCLLQIQTNRPSWNQWGTWNTASNSTATAGDFSIALVRNAPDHCPQ